MHGGQVCTPGMWLAMAFAVAILLWLARGARFRDVSRLRGQWDETGTASGRVGGRPEIHGPGLLGRRGRTKLAAIVRDRLDPPDDGR